MERHIRLMSPGGEIIVSPVDLAVAEQLRAESSNFVSPSGPPVDIFVWGKGEPANRAATKIGGLPYWPANDLWPAKPDGSPLPFIAQISFLDSKDIVPKTPGDVLLIFGDRETLCNEPERLFLRWLHADVSDLVSAAPESNPDERIAPLYGVIHRTSDLPSQSSSFANRYKRGDRLAVLEGTKIGGAPPEIQPRMTFGKSFVCALGSVSVGGPSAYPFVNVPEPAGWSFDDDDVLQIGDMGSVCFWRSWNGKFTPTADYY